MPTTQQEVESFRQRLNSMPRNIRGSRFGESDAIYTRGERKRLARAWANAQIMQQRASEAARQGRKIAA